MDLEDILYQALETPVGLAIKTNNPDLLRKKFNAIRTKYKKKGLEVFNDLTFSIPPHVHNEVWLIRKENSHESEREPEAGEGHNQAQ